MALAVGSLLAGGAFSLGAPPGGPIAAFFPPWWNGTQAMLAAAAGGLPVRFGSARFIVVVVPDTQDATRLLHRAGAWLLLNPRVLGGCAAA